MSQICNFIQDVGKEVNILPDDLYYKCANFVIDISRANEVTNIEFDRLVDQLNEKGYHTKIDCNDTYSLLRRVLPNDQEFIEQDASLKKAFSYICISHKVFIELLQYLNRIIIDYGKYTKSTRNYYKHYVHIQDTLDALEDLCEEYGMLLNRIRSSGPWLVDLPYPDDIINMVSDALLKLKNGDISIPLLRSYFEVKSSIFLENSLNDLLRHSNIKEYEKKKILFTKSMGFGDLIKILDRFKILSQNDIDIVTRMHSYTSNSIHIGSFLDKNIAWYLLFYLRHLKLDTAKPETLLLDFIKQYQSNNKFKIISKYDNVSDYSRFQSSSRQID
jgi:hypothetical protein